MRIQNLKLTNIGPFKDASIEFFADDNLESPPVVCITGENGTGKSIIIDSIRALLNGAASKNPLERDIVSSKTFSIESTMYFNDKLYNLKSNKKGNSIHKGCLETNCYDINRLFSSGTSGNLKKDFIFDYWTSKLSNDSFNINNITTLIPQNYLEKVLLGKHNNVDLTKAITFFDYLKDSIDTNEQEIGKSIYKILEEIINTSIIDGFLSHVSRINLTPIIKIANNEITLDKLSSGNLYLIQRFVSLLSQIYSICILNQINISEYKSIKGVLIIDEAENHLHPKWQKIFLGNIRKIFPKLQLIVATHSPFIVSSIENCRVYVCKKDGNHSIIQEETDFYSNRPIEEILLSPLFDTRNFNAEITNILDERKKAHEENNLRKKEELEQKLLEINPEYFDYLNLDKIIGDIKNDSN